MAHPEEHVLELHVLNSPKVGERRGEIEAHLRECAGCRALSEEISEFYAGLDRQVNAAPAPAPGGGSHALVRRTPGLALRDEGMVRAVPPGWSTPVRNLRYHIRRHPIAAAGTTFAFASLAALGALTGYREWSRDVSPSYATINSQTGALEVYNRSNEMLWNRVLLDPSSALTAQQKAEISRFALLDVDGDSRPEVVTPLPMLGEPTLPTHGLHIIDGRGVVSTLELSRRVSFRGNRYEMPIRIEAGSLVFIDSTDPADPGFLVVLKNDRSPNALVRIDRHGTVLGEYWHQGHLTSAHFADVNNDGRKELMLCGINDVDDRARLSHPVAVILDPARLRGVGESLLTRGFGHGPSRAELMYIQLPLTELNRLDNKNATIARMRIQEGRPTFLWTARTLDDTEYDLEFVFSPSMEPLRVISATQSHQLFEREFAAGKISVRLDDAYLERLRSEVRFWDGSTWSPGPAWMAPLSAKTGAEVTGAEDAPAPVLTAPAPN